MPRWKLRCRSFHGCTWRSPLLRQVLAHFRLLQERGEVEIYIFNKYIKKKTRRFEWNDLNKDFHLTEILLRFWLHYCGFVHGNQSNFDVMSMEKWTSLSLSPSLSKADRSLQLTGLCTGWKLCQSDDPKLNSNSNEFVRRWIKVVCAFDWPSEKMLASLDWTNSITLKNRLN